MEETILRSGTPMITTIHAGSTKDIMKRLSAMLQEEPKFDEKAYKEMIENGFIHGIDLSEREDRHFLAQLYEERIFDSFIYEKLAAGATYKEIIKINISI